MSRKFFPNYRISSGARPVASDKKVVFKHQGAFFTSNMPLLGATETQKAVLRWASWNNLPPIMSVEHDKPTKPDKDRFVDPNEFHRAYHPYAMAIATAEILGDHAPKRFKVYFCNVVLHEENFYINNHREHTDVYIVPLA